MSDRSGPDIDRSVRECDAQLRWGVGTIVKTVVGGVRCISKKDRVPLGKRRGKRRGGRVGRRKRRRGRG